MDLKPIEILLADDDQDDRQFFDEALKTLSTPTHLTTVNDGEQLLNYLMDDNNILPDVLFLDINMPRKNGIECLAEIKQNKKLKNFPVVMFSTSNSWDKISKLFKSGAHVYIHKPGDFTELKEVISHALPIAMVERDKKSKVKYLMNA